MMLGMMQYGEMHSQPDEPRPFDSVQYELGALQLPRKSHLPTALRIVGIIHLLKIYS